MVDHKRRSWLASVLPESKHSRELVLLAIALGLFQQLTGTEAILYYTPAILNQCPLPGEASEAEIAAEEGRGCVGLDTVFMINIGVGLCKLVGELVAATLVDKLGRRQTLVRHFASLELA